MTKIHESRHPEWLASADKWRRHQAAYRGGEGYAQSAITPHPRESEANKRSRLARVHTYNYCPMIIDTRTAYIRKTEPNVILPPSLTIDDLDGRGNSAPEVIKIISDMMQTEGTCFIFVDKPKLDAAPQTLAEQIAVGDVPYMSFLSPLDVLNAGMDGDQIAWVLIAQPAAKQTVQGNEVSSTELPPYVYWDREVIRIIDKGGATVEERPNPLGFVPIVPVRYKTDINRFYGLSILEDIEPINRRIINKSSLLDEILHNQTFSQLVVQDDLIPDKVMDEKTGMMKNKPVLTGTSEVLYYRENMSAPAYIAPDPNQGHLILASREKDIEEIHRLAELKRGSVTNSGNMASGISKAFDFLDTNQSLSDQAQSIAHGLERACEYMLAWMGQTDVNGAVQITFPHDFGVDSVGELVTEFIALNNIFNVQIPGQISELYLNKIVTSRFPDLSKKEREEMKIVIRDNLSGDRI